MRTASLASPATATASAATGRTTRAAATAAIRWTAWSVSAVLALGFLTVPIGAEAQMELCGAAIAAMAVLWLVFPRRGLPRTAFLALGSLVVIRYAYWRLSGTLPSTDDVVSFGLGLVLVAAEAYCFTILAVSLIINAEPLVRADAPQLDEAALPTVDIFIPTYNEDAGILSATVAAAQNLDYPADKLTVWLLDDGGSDQKCADADPAKRAAAQARRVELQALCAELGARYLTRARNEHAKAGNLNNGLKASRADIVVVLDADHAPFRPFLRETVGLFSADPKLFLVQTPHVFLNPDPIERNLRTFARMPSENEMFYAVTQRGLDKWNGSFFCGSAALLRRAALDEVGGFSGITITEDCETAFELHSRGWTSAYVDKPLIAGLQPETFADFIGQRARWCQGMFQIMLLKNPMTKPGLKPIQRLGYLSSMAYWFFPLPRLIFMLAPLLHIFFDVKIFVSSVDEALAFTATYVVVNMMLQNYLYGHVRWPWVSELYEYVQGVYLARSIASVLISPRKPTFNVTAKGANLDQDHISPLAWPFFAIFGALALGCGTAAFRYLYEPGVTSLMLVVGLWCLFNLVIAGAALGVVSERAQAERSPSLAITRRGTTTFGGESFPVAVERISADGCTLRRCDGAPWPRLEGTPESALGSLVGCALTGEGRLDPLGFSVRAAQGEDARVVGFENLTPASYRGLADLMYGDATPLWDFLASRRRPVGLLSGSLRFLGWGLLEPVRAFTLLARTRGRMPAVKVAAAPARSAMEIVAAVPVAVPVAAQQATTAIADAPVATVEHRPVFAALEPAPMQAPVAAARVAPAAAPAVTSSADELPVLRLSAEAWLAGMVSLANLEIAEAEATRADAPAELNPRAWMTAILQMALADTPAVTDAPRQAARTEASHARRSWAGPPTATLIRNAA